MKENHEVQEIITLVLQLPWPKRRQVIPAFRSRLAVNHSTIDDDFLRKLRACNHFWIQALNPQDRQLQLSLMSRVFFCLDEDDLSLGTFGTIRMIYNGRIFEDCLLCWKLANSMERLTLPPCSAIGLETYGGQVLLFTRKCEKVGPLFELTIGTPDSSAKWLQKSSRINAVRLMKKKKRQFGAF